MITKLIVGLLAGWVAGLATKGKGFGFFGNIIIGLIGAFIGGHLLDFLGIYSHGFIASVATATIGALVLLFLANLITQKRRS